MKKITILAVLGLGAMSACAPTTDADRAIIGAAAGAAAAKIDGRDDKTVILGAIGGASAGVICDDLGVCKNRGPYYSRPYGIYQN